MKKAIEAFSFLLLGLALAVFLGATMLPMFSGQVAIVRSSSMEPAMPAGSLALMLAVSPEEVVIGDIITFDPSWDSDPDVTISHRVIEIIVNEDNGELIFDTKGDALEDSDPYYVKDNDIIGRVVGVLPGAGFFTNSVMEYVGTPQGFIFLIALPSIFIVGDTVRGVTRNSGTPRRRKELKKRRDKRSRK